MESISEKAERILRLRERVSNLDPHHDTPVGKMHPYWARKPLNIVEEVISALSEPGDTVVDPFMGSGTTLFASRRLGRAGFGSDISNLSLYMVQALLDIANYPEQVIAETKRIIERHREITLPLYSINGGAVIERMRYNVRGEYSNGLFNLTPVEVVSKEWVNGKWTRRNAFTVNDAEFEELSSVRLKDWKEYTDQPIDFSSINLKENSRIAIPSGATLAHYFTVENQISINVLLSLIHSSPLYKTHADALKFILSGSLPLLRLSDWKASSQWPYWRPKNNLTSRNPMMVLDRKFKQYLEYVKFVNFQTDGTRSQLDPICLSKIPAQKLTTMDVGRPADLVLTDPPYGDQVPYLEYSELWNSILGTTLSKNQWVDELVMTNRVQGRRSRASFYEELGKAFSANARLLEDGFLVWFYQDQDLNSWAAIADSARDSGLHYCGCISVEKQRRSLKTVASPGRTLDGDLILIFCRDRRVADLSVQVSSFDATGYDARSDYYGSYIGLIDEGFRTNSFGYLAKEFGTVVKALKRRER